MKEQSLPRCEIRQHAGEFLNLRHPFFWYNNGTQGGIRFHGIALAGHYPFILIFSTEAGL